MLARCHTIRNGNLNCGDWTIVTKKRFKFYLLILCITNDCYLLPSIGNTSNAGVSHINIRIKLIAAATIYRNSTEVNAVWKKEMTSPTLNRF